MATETDIKQSELSNIDPKYAPRVGAEERAEELGLPDPGLILSEAQDILSAGATNVDQDLLKEKKKEFYRSIMENEPEIWEFMKKNNGLMTQDQWETLSVDQLEQARIIAHLQAPKQEKGFDYTSGVGSTNNDGIKFSRWKLSSLDTNTEKEDYLNATVGYDGWTTDKFGRYALTQNGLDILGLDALKPDEKARIIDEYQGFTAYDWVDAAPHIVQTIPAVGASVALSPYGTVIGILGTGMIGTTGYLADEVLEYSQGWSNQSAESIAAMAAEYGMYNALGEGVIRGLRPFGRMLSDPQAGLFSFRPSAPYTRAGVLKAYPGLENDIRVMYGTAADGQPLPEVEIQKLVNKAIKHLRFKTPMTGDTTIPNAADPFNPNAKVGAGMENERRAIIQNILEGNGTYSGVPSIDMATNRPLLARFQGMLDTIFNRPRDDVNRRYLNHTMLLLQGKAAGMSDDMLKNYVAKFGTSEELSAINELNEQILKRATDSSQSYDDALKMILINLEKETDEAISLIRSETGLLSDDLGANLATRLQQVKYSTDTAIESYALHLDESLHGLKLFDTSSIKSQINIIKNALPKTADSTSTVTKPAGPPGATVEVTEEVAGGFNTKLPGVKQVVELIEGIEAMPQKVSAAEMQMLNKLFVSLKSDAAKASGLDMSKEIDNILTAIDDSFANAKGVLDNHTTGLNVSDKVKFKEAYNLLDNLTELKSSSKGMFDDVFVAKMIKDAQSGAQGFIEAEDVVTYFVDQGRSKAFLRLMNALPASEREVFKAAIARHTFDDVLNSSKNNMTGGYDGAGFLNAWSKIDDGIKKTLFGNNSPKINQLAKEIAMKNGKFSQDEIQALLNSSETNISKLLNDKLKLINQADEEFGKSWMKKILGDDVEVEQVIDYIFRPKSATKINQAKEFMGPDMFAQFKEVAMMKILQNVGSDATQPGLGPIFNGPAFRKALDLYGKESLHAMFGKELTKDLYKFANEVTVLTSKNQSGGLVAANVALSPIRKGKAAIPPLAFMKVFSYLMNRPGFVEYLTFGIKNPYSRKGADALAKVNALAGAQGVQEKLVTSEGQVNERLPIEQDTMMDTIMDLPSNIKDTVLPEAEEVPVSSMSMPNVNSASRLASAFAPTTNTGPINPNTMAKGSQLFSGPNEITFAAEGGIMNARKPVQRVA
jgi:hypothetical protein